jgi:hypothetical protein
MGTAKFLANPDAANRVVVVPNEDVFAVSATTAAAANNQSIPAKVGKTAYISGFEITGLGATAAVGVAVTVTGVQGGTLQYTIAAVAGATLINTPLVVAFNPPLPASATNTAITVNVPTYGAGNTRSCNTVRGFYI